MRDAHALAQRAARPASVMPVGLDRRQHAHRRRARAGSGSCPSPSRGACRRPRSAGPARRASMARRNAPSLNGSSSPPRERVPSGKIITDTRLREPVAACGERGQRAVAVAAPQRDVAGHAHHPAHHRDAEDRLLRQPLHLPREVADEEDVRVRLVVGDGDVRPARIRGWDRRSCGSARAGSSSPAPRRAGGTRAPPRSVRGRTAP